MPVVPIRIVAMHDFSIQTSEQLSSHLRSLRKRLKLTQAELGTRLGVEQARIGKIERSPGSISVDQLLQLLTALNARLLLQPREARAGKLSGPKVEW